MKRLMLLPFCIIVATAASLSSDIQKEIKTSSGKRLEMNLKCGGSISIVGWDKEVVAVDVDLDGRDGEDCKVEINEASYGVKVYAYYDGWGRGHSSSLRFEVKVPKKYNLEIQSMGGEIAIAGVEGDMRGKTMGGALDLKELKGKLSLRTMGGNITLVRSDVDGEVQTNGGKVLFEDVTGNVKGHSMGGAVTYRNVADREGKSTGEEVRISTMGGEINVDDAPQGADVKTMGGNIKIRSAANHVKAKTMGGDIRIDRIDGTVYAETMGGDVEVTMVGDPSKGDRDVEILSKGGDITLVVPPALSMNVDISLAYTRNARKDYKIISDFNLQQEETKEWDRWNGTPRKYIYGTGSINGGKNRVRIETINGNVYLKKGKS